MRAQFVFHEVWIGLRRNLTMTVALIVVVAISLSLLGTGLLFVKQVDNTRQFWQSRVQLSVYLCTSSSLGGTCTSNGPVTPAEIKNIRTELEDTHDILSLQYVSQQQAYQQFRQEFADDEPIVRYTSQGQIPSSFEIRLKNTEADAAAVTAVMNGAPGVSGVIDDASILDQFYGLLDGARNAVVVIAIFLLVAAILLVANTIRLSAFNRRRETSIMRLVGASNFYVQLPFLVEGMIAGLIGWLVATGLLIGAKSLLLSSLHSVFPVGVQLRTADLVEVIIVAMITGLLICGSTSFLTLRRYLRV
ncbi:MAG TPA: permease-like cell division protein FtsX [Streptosporangiaceae bacterium]|nr:permease-like cell division protein FtsX [Streptosporangiaceae bacterium]